MFHREVAADAKLGKIAHAAPSCSKLPKRNGSIRGWVGIRLSRKSTRSSPNVFFSRLQTVLSSLLLSHSAKKSLHSRSMRSLETPSIPCFTCGQLAGIFDAGEIICGQLFGRTCRDEESIPQWPQEPAARVKGRDFRADYEYDVIRVRRLLLEFNGPFSGFVRSV